MTENTYLDLNAEVNLWDQEGKLQLDKDKDAARAYFREHVNQNTVFFHNLEEKAEYLVANGYWNEDVVYRYGPAEFKSLHKYAYSFDHRFDSLLGALKFYSAYALRTNDGERYLERFEDRVVMNAVEYSSDIDHAYDIIEAIITKRYQPATPTFMNAGRANWGAPVSCFLLRIDDNLESISRAQTDASQLSKRGGGVGLLLTNIREEGAPIKGREGVAKGVVPVMKILEDTFSYVDQLGARQGAGAVYLNAHHPDIMRFLDTKRENADEKIRIKTLSLGVVLPDITFELAKNNEDMYLFSPYDVERTYGVPFSDISITEKYREMVDNPEIRKTKINTRRFFQALAEVQFESGYPYIMYEDTANRANPVPNIGKIVMSNLCVTGDTQLLTSEGYRRADELWETQEDFEVIVDERARTMSLGNVGTSVQKSSKMFKTATDADVYKVTTAEGHEIKATEWHKFYVDRDGELIKIPLAELKVGDRLLAHQTDFSTVASIEFYGVEDVYDPTVENGHSVIYNGLVTGQCSEIFQPQTPSAFNEAGEFHLPGRDVSCNLGSLNIAKVIDLPKGDFTRTVETAYKMLTNVAEQSSDDLECSPTVKWGNDASRAIGLGQMNLHGALIERGLAYDSEEAKDLFRSYMSDVSYVMLNASKDRAEITDSPFQGFRGSRWESGEKIDEMIQSTDFKHPNGLFSKGDWKTLKKEVARHGLYNQHLQAIPPTGSISYINGSTSSIHPITAKVEARKEGKIGRVYYPAYGLTDENFNQVEDAYDIGPEAAIDMYAVAQPFVDQGMSLTLFFKDTATTRDINRAQIYAHKAGVKSLYYIRMRNTVLAGTSMEECVSCTL